MNAISDMSLILFMRQIRDSTSLLSSTRCSWTWPMLHVYVRLSLRRLYMQTVKRFFTWIDLQLISTHAGRNDWSYSRNFSVSSSTVTGFLFVGIEIRTPAATTPYSERTQLVIMDETLVSWCFNHNPQQNMAKRGEHDDKQTDSSHVMIIMQTPPEELQMAGN